MVLDGLPRLSGLKYDSATTYGLPLYLRSYKLVGSATPKGARGGPRLQNGFFPVKMCAGLRSRCASLEGGLHSPSY